MKQSPIAAREKIPFIDIVAQHDDLLPEILEAWERILRNGMFAGGPEVAAFEDEFASYLGCSETVGTGSGTSALRLALQALGIRPGDEVITVPHTFIATTEAITQAGGRPVFVDVEPHTGTMDPARVEAAITDRTKVLLPVHLYGQSADMNPLLELARKHGLKVLEDAAQSHGSRYHGRRTGTLGDAAAFSFYPGKNLGACGEAGAVATDDAQVARRIRMLRDHGQSEKYVHQVEGTNARMDGLQGAALRIKLRRLDGWNALRSAVARRYTARLRDSPAQVPEPAPGRDHVYHLYVVRHPRRDELRTRLGEAGIATGLHYPVPLHLQPAYRSLSLGRGAFPHAERWAAEGLSLPIFPGMTDGQVDRVCETLLAAMR